MKTKRRRVVDPPQPGHDLSHVSPSGSPRMVDVSHKLPTTRFARAEAWVDVGRAIELRICADNHLAKGNVLETARLAGIMAVKRTSDLIPLCHPLTIDAIEIVAALITHRVRIECRVTCEGKTGVEMEALTGATVAALTVYDMVKALNKDVTIGPIRLLEKSGGKSGRWTRTEDDHGAR